jgi:hypothetical protein
MAKTKKGVAQAGPGNEGPTELTIAGWKLVKTNNAWCWQEPDTRARYRLEDALALIRSLRAPHIMKGSRNNAGLTK